MFESSRGQRASDEYDKEEGIIVLLKKIKDKLNNFKFNSALFVYDKNKLDQNFKRASSNIPHLNLLSQTGINVKDLILHEKIFILKDSINAISENLS